MNHESRSTTAIDPAPKPSCCCSIFPDRACSPQPYGERSMAITTTTTTTIQYDWAALVGRLLLAAIFVMSGFSKIGGFEGTAGYIAGKGLPIPQVLAALTIAIELGGGILLVLGWKSRWAALAIAVFTLLAALIFHNYWTFPA